MSSAAQAKKDAIISELVEVRRKIFDAASALSQTQQDQIFLGVWSIKDLLAHLAGWDFTNLEAAQSVRAGKLPDFYLYYDRDWKTYNAQLVSKYKRDNFADLLAVVRDSHQKLVDFLTALPAEEFDKDTGVRFEGYKVTIARLLQTEIKDEKVHHAQIEEFRTGRK